MLGSLFTGLALSDSRRQDLAYRNLFHVFLFPGGRVQVEATATALAVETEEAVQAAAIAYDHKDGLSMVGGG